MSLLKWEERQTPYDITYTCRIQNMTQMTLSTKQKETHKASRRMVAEGEGGGKDWEPGLADAS